MTIDEKRRGRICRAGKTTLIRMLAGNLKPDDDGKKRREIRVESEWR